MTIGLAQTGEDFVIVRAAGDEPVLMVALGRMGRQVEVARPGSDVSIEVPISYVFAYKPDRLAQLQEAYTSRDADRIAREWDSTPHLSET